MQRQEEYLGLTHGGEARQPAEQEPMLQRLELGH